jgi:protein TonB
MKDLLALLIYTVLGIAFGLHLLLSKGSGNEPAVQIEVSTPGPIRPPIAQSEMPTPSNLGAEGASTQRELVTVTPSTNPIRAVPEEPAPAESLETRSERKGSRGSTAPRAPPQLRPRAANGAQGSYREPASYSFPAGTSTSEYYPNEALGAGVRGVATVHCTVRATGLIHSCATAQEFPAGYGFGRAAARLVLSNVHATPERINGIPTNDGTITVSIRFQPN